MLADDEGCVSDAPLEKVPGVTVEELADDVVDADDAVLDAQGEMLAGDPPVDVGLPDVPDPNPDLLPVATDPHAASDATASTPAVARRISRIR